MSNIGERLLEDFAAEHHLTTREKELLNLMSLYGYTHEQIAEALKISQRTVHIHMGKLLTKTGCSSSKELLSKIIQLLLEVNSPQKAI